MNNRSKHNPKWMTLLAGILFVTSLGPVLWVTPYVRSTGDDLNYSAGVHLAMQNGAGLWDILMKAVDTAKGTWYSWQGTWSSVTLFSLQPGIWGNAWYPITVMVALICIIAGTWYFFHTIVRLMGMNRAGRWTIAFLLGVLLIQYLPNVKCGLFWWTSVAHYIIPYGITLMCMGWALRWLESGQYRFLIGMILGMSYLGGAGYPEVVLAAVWTFLLISVVWLERRWSRKRTLCLIIPLLLEMVGFAVSAAAPGNKNRGGEDFGFSLTRVGHALYGCVKEGVLETLREFIRVRPLVLLVFLVVIFAWKCTDVRKSSFPVQHPVLFSLLNLSMICLVHAPVIYAEADPSGGVPDSYWLITVTLMVVWLIGMTIWVKARFQTERNRCLSEKPLETYAFTAVLVLCLLMARHIIGGTTDYICVQFAKSGALSDYHVQMEEWLDILEDPSIENAELPAMNDQQGPFMLMVPLADKDAWSSSVYARYYGKESVICVPRKTDG